MDLLRGSGGQTRELFRRRSSDRWPERVGPFRLLGVLGRGGMGVVYRAEHETMRRAVALKLLSSAALADSVAAARFRKEVEAAGRLDHPNIVRATDAGEYDGGLYLAMDLIDGVDLSRTINRLGPVRLADACELMRQAALGLQHVHEHGLVHRDVKPSNLMLGLDGRLRLLDLGLAKFVAEAARSELTTTGAFLGTVDYMAPEQALDARAASIRSDLYSLGCTLYKLLTGEVVFGLPRFETCRQRERAHAEESPPWLRHRRPDAPPELEALLLRLLAKDPKGRPAEPAEVAAALEPFAHGSDLPGLAAAALGRPDPPDVATPSHLETFRSPGNRLTPRGAVAPSPAARSPARRLVALAAVVAATLALGVRLALPDRKESVADRKFLPNVWVPLLDRKPEPVLWPADPNSGSRWDYDARKRSVWVSCVDDGAALMLGRLDEPNFRLKVVMLQPQFDGYAGVFWGFRDDPKDAGRVAFHSVGVGYLRGPGVGSHCLERRHFNVRRDSEDAWLGRLSSHPVVPPPQGRPYALEVVVRNHALEEVIWDGRPADLKVPPEVAVHFPAATFRGPFGLFAARSGPVFQDAQVMVLRGERE
jgi:eukaryotic-like serine/threonine-protein kinase